jgi:hypothetical protein
MYGYVRQIGNAMTREQIKKVSKQAAQKVADPKSGTPASKKHVQRLAELKHRRASASDNAVPVDEKLLRA